MRLKSFILPIVIITLLCKHVVTTLVGKMTIQTNNYQLSTVKKSFEIKLAIFSNQAVSNLYINVSSALPLDGCLQYSSPQLQPPYLIMVDGQSGNCGYRQKAQSAKEAGAKGIIIIDDGAYIEKTIPYDKYQDGSFLIFLLNPNSVQGNSLELLTKSKSYQASIDVRNPNPSQQETYSVQLWLSAIDYSSYQTISDWSESLTKISSIKQKNIKWTVNYAILGCQANDVQCKSLHTSSCACQGLFCSPKFYGKAPSIMIAQDVRQKLIFENHRDYYFSYMEQFKQKCLQLYQEKLLIDSCSYRIMQSLGLDPQLVKKQTNDATEQCSGKTFEQILTDKIKYKLISTYPSILVNRRQIHYKNHRDLRKQLCENLNLMDDPGCAHKTGGIIMKTIVGVIVFILILAGLILIGMFMVRKYKQSLKKQMQKQLGMQISTAVEHYYTLSQSK